MPFDLNGALQDAADRATRPRPGIPAGPVLRRVRRRRAARTVTHGAVGVAAAAAIAIGGIHLAERAEPPPPAGPGPVTVAPPDRAADPAPTDGALVVPPGAVVACGARVDELLEGDAAGELGLDLTVDLPVPVRHGATLALATLTAGAAPLDLTLSHLGLVLTRDDVVVAVTGRAGVPRAATISAADPLATGDQLRVWSCAALSGTDDDPMGEDPARGLDPGTYTAWPVALVVPTAELDGVTLDGPGEIPAAVLRYVVAEPRPIELHAGDARHEDPPPGVHRPDRVFRSITDGAAWWVVGEEGGGRDAAASVRSALLEDGLEVVWEQELGHQYWGAALTDGRRWVTASVSSWTGGGSMSDIRVWGPQP